MNFGPNKAKYAFGPPMAKNIYGPSTAKNIYGPPMAKYIYGPPMAKNIYGPSMAENTLMLLIRINGKTKKGWQKNITNLKKREQSSAHALKSP